MKLWLLIAGMTLVTFANRAAFIVLIGRYELPPLLRRSLRYVPAAAITAVVAPALFMPEGALHVAGNLRLAAGLVAVIIAWRTHSPVLTMVGGMAALYALRAVSG